MTVKVQLLHCCMLGCTLAAGCRSGQYDDCGMGHRLHEPGVTHVVIFWLKEPGNEAARDRIMHASISFRSIPGVLSVETGVMHPADRAHVDKTYDVAVVIELRDRMALETYQVHPRHQAMLKEVGPLVERVVVYDFLTYRSAAKK